MGHSSVSKIVNETCNSWLFNERGDAPLIYARSKRYVIMIRYPSGKQTAHDRCPLDVGGAEPVILGNRCNVLPSNRLLSADMKMLTAFMTL